MKLALFLIAAIIDSAYSQAGCWTTGCQPNNWATVGCAQYNMKEMSKQSCSANGSPGNKYHCCPPGGNPAPNPGNGNQGGEFMTFDQFTKAVTSNGYPAPSREQYTNFNKFARSRGKISTKEEAAMALAQILHESDGLKAKREYACAQSNCPGSYREPAGKNCEKPNQYYYGRGYIQLTWCENYKGASNALFGDNSLVDDPDKVARDDKIAWEVSFWYWSRHVHDLAGVQNGHFGATTKGINGPIECSRPGHPTPPKRFGLYSKVRAAMGLQGPGNPAGCA